MKNILSLFLAVLLVAGNLIVLPVNAEESQSADTSQISDTVTEESKGPEEPAPSEDIKPAEPSKPEESKPSDPTQDNTPEEPSEPKPCTTHTYGDWAADEGNHWKACTVCGHKESAGHSWEAEKITVNPTCGEPGGVCKLCTVCQGVLVTELIPPTGKHTYDNTCDTSCNVCGTERTVEHTFGTGWKYSGKGHWHYCTICGAADVTKEHYPGPAATEEKDQICLTCGMVMMKKKPHSHKWDAQWSSDAGNHWYSCTVCQEKDKTAAHTYDDGCDTDCNVCGYIRTAAHTYGPDWNKTELTHCGVCTVCGEETPAENHVADSSGAKCGVCGYIMEAAEDTHEHIFVEDTWGFDEDGHWNLCMCGEKDNAEPHSWDEGSEKGKQILYTCEVCGAEKTEKVPEKTFPWLMAAAGGTILICLAGIVICIVLIRRNREDYE